ncbi:alpha/beta hydrolase family protein [Hydrocarboniphaga sp.]|uniref:alpha/beta hydrolase family protein n=1 Tax=Hydrocarboniphaga sp. TaxID=2033016 RepID=UPI003D1372BC
MSMQIAAPRQWEWMALIPLLAGLYALVSHEGFLWWVFAGIPGTLVLASGVALLMMPGDPRVTAYMSLGSLVGVLFALPLILAHGFGAALVAALLFVGSFLVAGRTGLRNEPVYEGAADLHLDVKMDAKAALDEAVLGYFLASASVPSGETAARMSEDAVKLEAMLDANGWQQHPETFHKEPPPPERVQIHKARLFGVEYERASFDSGFTLPPELPGAQVWMGYEKNNRCVANVLRHPGAPRPWLVCIHGYRMGETWLDFSLFSPQYLHHHLGLNVLMPTLPLHGSRKIGLRTGDHYLDGDLLDLLYAESQALWDLRRWLAWLRTQEENPAIGVYGISLGGYNASLLAGYAEGLDFVVAGIPIVDLAIGLWRFVPSMHQRYLAWRGLDEKRYQDILRVVSPLARPPKLDERNLHIFAAIGDRIVAPRNPVMLSHHWKVPVTWYQGSHLSIRNEAAPRQVLEEAMGRAGWRSSAYATI